MRRGFGEPSSGTEALQAIKRAVELDVLEAELRIADPRQERRPAEELPKLLDEMLGSALRQVIRSARMKHVRTSPHAMSAREIAEAWGVRSLKELVTETRTKSDEK